MNFWFGYDIGDMWFQGLKINSVGSMCGICFTLFVLTILYEGLKVYNFALKNAKKNAFDSLFSSKKFLLFDSIFIILGT